jgi:hypothetical protein
MQPNECKSCKGDDVHLLTAGFLLDNKQLGCIEENQNKSELQTYDCAR